MPKTVTNAFSAFCSYRFTKRDIRMVVFSAILGSAFSAGAVTVDGHYNSAQLSQKLAGRTATVAMDNTGICSAAKYFR